MPKADGERTSIGLQADVKENFDAAKPGGLSANEFVSILVEHWEGENP